jgi:hypothetical protein
MDVGVTPELLPKLRRNRHSAEVLVACGSGAAPGSAVPALLGTPGAGMVVGAGTAAQPLGHEGVAAAHRASLASWGSGSADGGGVGIGREKVVRSDGSDTSGDEWAGVYGGNRSEEDMQVGFAGFTPLPVACVNKQHSAGASMLVSPMQVCVGGRELSCIAWCSRRLAC